MPQNPRMILTSIPYLQSFAQSQKITEMQELTSEIVATLIERSELGQAQMIDGVKKQKIKIIYDFIGNIKGRLRGILRSFVFAPLSVQV